MIPNDRATSKQTGYQCRWRILSIAIRRVGAFFLTASACFGAPQTSSRAMAAVVIEWKRDDRRIDALWKFEDQADQHSIRVTSIAGADERSVDLRVPGVTGRVVEIAARAHHVRDDWYMVVLGLGSLNAAGDSIEYRMLVQHAFEPLLVQSWMYTKALLTRPLEQRFDGMSISFPGGDSVAFGLHDLTRGGDFKDTIESHFFVNHCPTAGRDGEIVGTAEHYVSRITGSVDIKRDGD